MGSHYRKADVSIFLTIKNMSVVLYKDKEPSLQRRHACMHKHAHAHTVWEWGCSWGLVGMGSASSGLIKSSGDRGWLAACLPASLAAIFRSPALSMAVQLPSQIQIPARETDIFNCHSCLPKCETPTEQPNHFLFLGFSLSFGLFTNFMFSFMSFLEVCDQFLKADLN